jgi:hypothetical protein
MSFIEHLISVEINTDTENKTKELLDNINKKMYPFNLNYYFDNNNIRYFNISSYNNIYYYIYQLFNRYLVNYEIFYKTPLYLI